MIQWLKIYKEPWEEALKKWQQTFDVRRLSKSKTVEDFYDEWPLLKDLRAVELVCCYKLHKFFIYQYYFVLTYCSLHILICRMLSSTYSIFILTS